MVDDCYIRMAIFGIFCHQITMTSKMRNFIAKRLSEIIEVAPATRNYFESRLLGMKVLSTASTIVIWCVFMFFWLLLIKYPSIPCFLESNATFSITAKRIKISLLSMIFLYSLFWFTLKKTYNCYNLSIINIIFHQVFYMFLFIY